jgi:hypothetical protein
LNKTIKVVRVFLASPADVQPERKKVENVIAELNRRFAPSLDLHLEIVRWEDMVPGMGRPQRVILDQAALNDTDIFIGILWNYFGTPTGQANSGTDEEFRIAYDAWKSKGLPRIMFYFCQRPANLQTSEQLDQKLRVIKFRDQLSKMGLLRDYSKISEFEAALRDHLTQNLLDLGNLPKNQEVIDIPDSQIQKLFKENLAQLSKMNLIAGSMIKGLLWELQDNSRDTYIRLHDAADQGFIVHYDIVRGNPKLVALAAESLGFKSWENNQLEVYNTYDI